MIVKKYTSLCKKDYIENRHGESKRYLFKGESYEVHEEYWSEDTVMRKAIIPSTKVLSDDGVTMESESSYVGFLTTFFNYFYNADELRDMKLKEIGIHE